MAGSYKHVVDEQGRLLSNEQFLNPIDTLGDAYETIEEMYGMIWYLAEGNATRVEIARQNYQTGIIQDSPGVAD